MDRDEIIRELCYLKEVSQGKYSIVSIGLFGSVVQDRMNKQSDIDVVVELVKRDLFNIIGIKQDLEEQLSNRRYDQI